MGKIRILPTGEPTGLIAHGKNGELFYLRDEKNRSNWISGLPRHVYITVKEGIKKGDYVYNRTIGRHGAIRRFFLEWNGVNSMQPEDEKIVLTSDPSLIKEGIPSLDDDFMEWLVDNYRQDSIELKHVIKEYVDEQDAYGYDVDYYQVILPNKDNSNHSYLDLVAKKAKFDNKIDLNAYSAGVADGVHWDRERVIGILNTKIKELQGGEEMKSLNESISDSHAVSILEEIREKI